MGTAEPGIGDRPAEPVSLALIDPGQLATTARGVSASTADRISRRAAKNTRDAYGRAWATWSEWCHLRGEDPQPGTPQMLADYVNDLVEAGRSVSMCKQHIAAIRKHHKADGLRPPDFELANAVVQSAARERAGDEQYQVKQSTPVIVDALRKMVDTCDGDTLINTRDRAVLMLGIAVFGRRSELAALNLHEVRDVPEGLLVRIATSKTDKQSRGVDVPVLHGSFPGTDPVRAVTRWREALTSRNLDRGRLFRCVDGGQLGPQLSTASVNEIVQHRAGLAGLGDHTSGRTPAERGRLAGYSAHSLRAGGATIAYMNGAPVAEICRLGRWAPGSSVVLQYIRAVDQWKNHPFRGVL